MTLEPSREAPHHRDPLTGVFNRGFLTELLGERWSELTEHGEVAVLIVDLDAFKEVNDQHGHLTGDDLLQATARVLRANFRGSDIITRYGGDEFVIVAPQAGAQMVGQLAERARRALAAERLISRRTGDVVTLARGFSLGVASFPTDGRTSHEVLHVADTRLYEDKRRRGRTSRMRVARWALGTALAVALVVGLLIGSYLGARVETSVVPQAPASNVRLAEAEQQVRALQSRLAQLETDSRAPTDTPGPAPEEIAALEAQIAALRRQLSERPVPTFSREPSAPGSAVDERTPGLPGPEAQSGAIAAGQAEASEPKPDVSPAPPQHEEETLEPLAPLPIPTSQVPPEYPRLARALRREATVRVLVRVDSRGQVETASALGPEIGLGFEDAAVTAAKRTRFGPHPGPPRETTLTYRFVLVAR